MKAHRRRVSRRDFENGDSEPSLVEILLASLIDPAVKTTMHRVKRGAERVTRWTLERLLAGAIVAVILIVGLLLVLAAGVKGLEALSCPPWLAYLSMGVVALLAALLLLRRAIPPEREDDWD